MSTNGQALTNAARDYGMVFFTGLPTSGKSFFPRQMALSAAAAGRGVTLLRWDIGLGAFETEAVFAKCPNVVDGTHPVIRRAAGA